MKVSQSKEICQGNYLPKANDEKKFNLGVI